MTLLGIGNVLQKDDGFGVYASTYLKENYTFNPEITIVNGGVEGINLFSIFEQSRDILILDTIQIEDTPASIYAIPAKELSGHGLNSGGAHEIGVLQCLDMLELQGKELPKATVLGIVPEHITFDIALSDVLKEAFNGYIKVVLGVLEKEGIDISPKKEFISLIDIIGDIKRI
jgi:hydrogenase maturation protease